MMGSSVCNDEQMSIRKACTLACQDVPSGRELQVCLGGDSANSQLPTHGDRGLEVMSWQCTEYTPANETASSPSSSSRSPFGVQGPHHEHYEQEVAAGGRREGR